MLFRSIFYLDKKKINDVAVDDIKKFVTLAGKQKNAEMLISNEEMIAENESLFITVDPKKLYAKVRLYPHSNKGLRLETEDIISLLEQQGVVHGILYENIALMQRLKLYCTDILVAKATMPVHGHDAQIHYNFNLDKTNKPAMDENGRKKAVNLFKIYCLSAAVMGGGIKLSAVFQMEFICNRFLSRSEERRGRERV